MKKRILLFILNLVCFSGNAQEITEDSKPVYIGLDLVKGLTSYVFTDKYFIRNTVIIEPYLKFASNNPLKHLIISGGIVHGSSQIKLSQIPQFQNFQGVYIKMAFENQYRRFPLRFGYGPLLSFAGFKGEYSFKGPTFGDYTANFTDDQNFAIGAETYLAYDWKLNMKLILRFQARAAVAMRMTGDISPDYFPGIGITQGMSGFLLSPGFSTQLFFRVH